MKKLGIIGGLGPAATAYLMERITEMTDASCDQEHIEMLIYSMPSIPDRTNYILDHNNPNPLPLLQEVASILESNGCDFLVLPCITAHYFHKALSTSLGCDLLHGIHACGKYLFDRGITTVGVMATTGTVSSHLFDKCFLDYGIKTIYPDLSCQAQVMSIIYDGVKACSPIDLESFSTVSDSLFIHGSQVIILGCTELSIVKKNYNIGHGFLDVIDIIAQSAVLECGKLKDSYKELIT